MTLLVSSVLDGWLPLGLCHSICRSEHCRRQQKLMRPTLKRSKVLIGGVDSEPVGPPKVHSRRRIQTSVVQAERTEIAEEIVLGAVPL